MKTLASICILSVILTGCSPEGALIEPVADSPAFNAKKSSGLPINPDNSKDYTGAIYYRLLDAYYALPPTPRTLQQIISTGESLAFDDPGFVALSDYNFYQSLSVSDVEPYIFSEDQDIESLLSESYSPKARNLYTELTFELSKLKNEEATYEEATEYLIGFENSISQHPEVSDDEASAILVTTSMLRHAMYHDKKRKRRDRDWDWMTTSVAATANAALESEAQAITVFFATDVYEN